MFQGIRLLRTTLSVLSRLVDESCRCQPHRIEIAHREAIEPCLRSHVKHRSRARVPASHRPDSEYRVAPAEDSGPRDGEATDLFLAITAGTVDLVAQITFTPRRLAA